MWQPFGVPPEILRRMGEQVDAEAGCPVGRSVLLKVSPGMEERFVEQLHAYEDVAGCAEVVLDIATDSLEKFVEVASTISQH